MVRGLSNRQLGLENGITNMATKAAKPTCGTWEMEASDSPASPKVPRRRLGIELRRMREQAGLTIE
jgi:hypothetical protein